MQNRVIVLRHLIRQSLYVIDEQAVAQAIIRRAIVRAAIAELSFHNGVRRRFPQQGWTQRERRRHQ